jgi:lysyl-tRNA synthetase class 2
MDTEDKIKEIRLDKAKKLKDLGVVLYPSHSDRNADIFVIKKNFLKWSLLKKRIIVAGRIMSQRGQGGIMFLNVKDDFDNIQIVFKKKDCEEFSYAKNVFDIGDFIEATGYLFKTQTGEKSLLVKKWKMLAKSLKPLPSEWYGFKDEEGRFRKRYLDILMNSEVKEIFVRKSKFWQSIRNFLLERDFLEVETPVLESVPGGADAKPFKTHHNALDMEVFLRISPELWLKRLMVAGFPKVFEIGRIFRNEGMDAEHLQDYTQMEFYWPYADYNDGMKLVEEMYKKVAKEVYGTYKFKIKEFNIDLGKKWETYDFVETIKEKTGIDILEANEKSIEKKLHELKIDYDKKGFNLTRAIDNLWKYCRKDIAGPGFLINVPVTMEPLAKRKSDNPELVERFQVILAGSEMGKGFSELNDPEDQMERFKEQAKLREQGDEEAQRTDNDFVEALEYGMPPTCGFGISERLFAFLEDKSVRETTLFPLMRKKEE